MQAAGKEIDSSLIMLFAIVHVYSNENKKRKRYVVKRKTNHEKKNRGSNLIFLAKEGLKERDHGAMIGDEAIWVPSDEAFHRGPLHRYSSSVAFKFSPDLQLKKPLST